MNDQTRTITLLQINDTHGYLESHPELFWKGGRAVYRTAGGYARIKGIFETARRDALGAVFAFDNGDTFHGTYVAVHSRGAALVDPVNLLGLDAWTAHWDFAYGPDRLRELAGQLRHPLLAINCYDAKTGERPFPAYAVIERGGLRVGVIGIAATIIDKTMPAHFSEGLRFSLGNEELPECIATLRERERADVVVVLSHLGFPQDVKLAGEVSGIDVLLSGHTHNRMESPLFVNGTPIIQSGCHGSFVGRLDIEVGRGTSRVLGHQLITVDESIEPDAAMQHLVDAAMAPYRAILQPVAGSTESALNRNTVLEATMDNFLLDAIAEAAGTEIAFSNGWRYGAPIVPGPVTINDLWNIIPPNPPVSVVELTGCELWDMLEQNLQNTFATDPYAQMGGYVKRCRGLTVYIKIENPRGTRVQQIFVGDNPIDVDAVYPVAFVTTQGVPKDIGRNRRDLPRHAVDALRQLLQRRGSIDASLRGTVVAI
jgi:2',3'-cyclic-nucleotide 2'-phosphodiesterase (5'-nucleotidase family)